jgi:lysophospholipase L1-like esterase
MTGPTLKIAISALFAAAVSATAQTPQIEKVPTPRGLTPLPMSIGGRVQPLPLASIGFGREGYLHQWPGTYFEASFTGSELFFQLGMNHEILHIVVDGKPPLILDKPDIGAYRISGLADRAHTVSVLVATESQGPNTFGGFAITAKEKPLPAKVRPRQIEFIGDSHTVGYGNTSPKRECTTDEVWSTTDNTQAFGPLTANHYQADYRINAISGRGIVRNYNGFAADTLPMAYPYPLITYPMFVLNQKHLDDAPNWKPQVIVIALGTNDFSTPLNPGEKWKTRDELHADYEATYLRFLHDLRAKNPDAYFILWATEMANGEIESEVKKVADQARAQGETKLTYLPIKHLTFKGCHFHPSLADDKTISDKLVQLIDANPAIWQGK